jgi:hypothetical protein
MAQPHSERLRGGNLRAKNIQDRGSRALDALQAVSQKLGVTIVELDVILSAGAYVCPGSTNFITEDSNERYSLSSVESSRAQRCHLGQL